MDNSIAPDTLDALICEAYEVPDAVSARIALKSSSAAWPTVMPLSAFRLSPSEIPISPARSM